MSLFLHRAALLSSGGGFVGGGAAEFSPADLFASSEYGAYYDPSDLSSLWQDTAGTTAVTAAGQSVARMDDLSGNGRHVVQATAANRPTYQTSGGLHWLDFDGSNDYMRTSSATASKAFRDGVGLGGSSWAAISSALDNAIGGAIVEQGTTGGISPDESRAIIYADTRTSPRRLAAVELDGFDTSTYIDLTADAGPGAVTFVLTKSGTTYSGYKDGSLEGTASYSGVWSTTARVFEVGRQLVGPLYFNGKFYGGGLIDRALSSTEISDITTWMQGKSGL